MRLPDDLDPEYTKLWEAVTDKQAFITKALDRTRVYGNPEINELFTLWESIVGYKIHSRIQANRNAASNLYKKFGRDGVEKLLRGVKRAQAEQYAPNIANFEELQQKLDKLTVWGRTLTQEQPTYVSKPYEPKEVQRASRESVERARQILQDKGIYKLYS